MRNLVERGLGGDHEPNAEDEAFLEELDAIMGGEDKAAILTRILKEVSEGGADQLHAIEKELRGLLVLEEGSSSGGEDPLQDVVDLIRQQIDEPNEERVSAIRDMIANHRQDCCEEAAKHLDAFSEDFDALVTSPVGIDEMMAEVLFDHLGQAGPLLEHSSSNNEEAPTVAADDQEPTVSTPAPSSADAADATDKKTASRSIRVNVQLL